MTAWVSAALPCNSSLWLLSNLSSDLNWSGKLRLRSMLLAFKRPPSGPPDQQSPSWLDKVQHNYLFVLIFYFYVRKVYGKWDIVSKMALTRALTKPSGFMEGKKKMSVVFKRRVTRGSTLSFWIKCEMVRSSNWRPTTSFPWILPTCKRIVFFFIPNLKNKQTKGWNTYQFNHGHQKITFTPADWMAQF